MQQKTEKLEQLKVLQEAFEQFNRQTEGLTLAYESLQKRASKIDKELEKKNIQLKDAIRYLDSLVRSMQSGLIALDGSQCIETINPVASSLFGIKEREAIGKPIGELFILEPLLPFVDQIIKGMPVKTEEVLIKLYNDKNNDMTLVEISASPIMSKKELKGILIIIRDLTEIKELRERVIRNENLADLGQMAVTVAHEIRNPLGGVEGFAALLRKDLKDDIKKRELADKILVGTRELNSFITNLLDFSRPLKVVKKKENIIDIVNKAIIYSEQYPKNVQNKIRVKKVFKDNIIHLLDGHLLFRLLLNIVINAYEAMEGKGTCEIRIELLDKIVKNKKADLSIKSINYRENNPFALITVKDTGPGIEKDLLKEIFRPFITSKNFGTGLGLPMVQKIMEALNGRIDVVSNKNKGTKFLIYVPLV
ncbi:MAG: PAS domain S-box protein [Candidatus Aureabacteria bacterium]|nr:PAS domain S-box protein [Candidatus Auribacterota bacterium]